MYYPYYISTQQEISSFVKVNWTFPVQLGYKTPQQATSLCYNARIFLLFFFIFSRILLHPFYLVPFFLSCTIFIFWPMFQRRKREPYEGLRLVSVSWPWGITCYVAINLTLFPFVFAFDIRHKCPFISFVFFFVLCNCICE